MKKTMKGLFLAGLSLIFSQASLADGGRTDLEGPGDAEVIAGTGYGHTLFGSADNKCQNCHNDLYDTWKTSMHAKSWKDPIFQSKYQDFLRLQTSKIDSIHPISGDTYMPGMVDKAGQVCIKCHAPTAFYSGDYEIRKNVVGNMNDDYVPTDFDDDGKPLYKDLFEESKAKLQSNLAPKYNPDNEATVVSVARNGDVYTVGYQIGHKHNREGINCSYCHSIETVRMMNSEEDIGDEGVYTTVKPMKMGPNGQVVVPPNTELHYNESATDPDMNKFFALIGPEKYVDAGDTPKVAADFDHGKAADGRYTMKSIETCQKNDEEDECDGTTGYYTGGPFYGPFGITGLSNSRDDDLSDRAALVKTEFQHAVEEGHEDKFESEHQFAAYGKALCLSCHQRSSLAVNPETNGIPGIQGDDQFLELCSTWTAMSDGVGDNFTDTEESPKCQRCHMEPLEAVTLKDEEGNKYGKEAVVLHQWDQPGKLFTLEDNPDLTTHFQPDSGVGPVAEGYLNNHAFMGANNVDFGMTKIKTGFEAGLNVKRPGEGNGKGKRKRKGNHEHKLAVNTYLLNKTAHMFPGAHPMRRALTRVVVTDADGNKLSFKEAKGKSKFEDITNQVATLDFSEIKEGFDEVEVKYDENREIVIQGYKPDLSSDEEYVNSQFMDQTKFDWVSPDATVKGSTAVQTDSGAWVIKGETTSKLITDIEGTADHFTRIYGRETGKRAPDKSHVVRPGFDSNIATDNRLKPNEMEEYAIEYDTEGAAYPLTVTYKVYYMKKGANGQFPVAGDGFLDNAVNKAKKFAIFEVFSDTVVVEGDD